MATFIPSINAVAATLDTISSRLTANQKKIDDAKHRIQVEESSFLSSRQPVDKDKGYNYYLRERENASKAGDIACSELGSKIELLEKKKEDIEKDFERKKEALLEELERKRDVAIKELDNKIEALERKKGLERESSQERADKHQKNLEGIISKYESMKPTSVVYNRLIAHVEELEKERDAIEKEYREATLKMGLAQEKFRENMMREAANKEREMRREQAIKDQEELRRIELREAAIRREEEERARRRVEEDNRKFREQEARKAVATTIVQSSRPMMEVEEVEEEEDPLRDFLFAKNNEWDGWWLNALYSREMYLEDKKKCKQEKNGIPVWKLSRWYIEETE